MQDRACNFNTIWESLGDDLRRFIYQNFMPVEEKLRRNPPDIGVTSGRKSCTKIIYIILQTSVGLF